MFIAGTTSSYNIYVMYIWYFGVATKLFNFAVKAISSRFLKEKWKWTSDVTNIDVENFL